MQQSYSILFSRFYAAGSHVTLPPTDALTPTPSQHEPRGGWYGELERMGRGRVKYKERGKVQAASRPVALADPNLHAKVISGIQLYSRLSHMFSRMYLPPLPCLPKRRKMLLKKWCKGLKLARIYRREA